MLRGRSSPYLGVQVAVTKCPENVKTENYLLLTPFFLKARQMGHCEMVSLRCASLLTALLANTRFRFLYLRMNNYC